MLANQKQDSDSGNENQTASSESLGLSKTDSVSAAPPCNDCYPKISVTNPGIAGGHIAAEIVFCPLHAAAPDLHAALKEARQMIFDLRGRAFVGSHTPRSQEPLLVGGAALDARIDAALALANGQVANTDASSGTT